MRNFIDTHQVVCAGPFIYAYVEEVIPLSLSLSLTHTHTPVMTDFLYFPGYTKCEVLFQATDVIQTGTIPQGGMDCSGLLFKAGYLNIILNSLLFIHRIGRIRKLKICHSSFPLP